MAELATPALLRILERELKSNKKAIQGLEGVVQFDVLSKGQPAGTWFALCWFLLSFSKPSYSLTAPRKKAYNFQGSASCTHLWQG